MPTDQFNSKHFDLPAPRVSDIHYHTFHTIKINKAYYVICEANTRKLKYKSQLYFNREYPKYGVRGKKFSVYPRRCFNGPLVLCMILVDRGCTLKALYFFFARLVLCMKSLPYNFSWFHTALFLSYFIHNTSLTLFRALLNLTVLTYILDWEI